MRGWTWTLLGSGLLLVGGAATWWLTGGPLRHFMPEQPFRAAAAPLAPDYADDRAWAALPGRAEESDLVPEGLEEGRLAPGKDAAVFFLVPTTFAGKHWNAPLDLGSRSQEFIERVLAAGASAFNAVGPVYAPHYRQATLFAFFTHEPDGVQALKLAYGDVERAFRAFLERIGPSQPYIIASHSQGTLHGYRLLSDVVDPDPELRARLVAAYLIGFPLRERDLDDRYPHIPVCDDEDHTGCLLTYSTWAEGETPQWDPYYWQGDTLLRQREDARRVCVNPLTWRRDRVRGEASLHLGALVLPALPEGHYLNGADHSGRRVKSLPELLPHHTRATCGRQALHIEEQSDPPYGSFYVEGNYHPHDMPLFYGNLRDNAHLRVRIWRATHPHRPPTLAQERARDDSAQGAPDEVR